ncbi:hypothetical protein T12_5526 [Trichinella patagoniensis]|uniref:Uncharacterized protein n=1 Tax=Trichinella patagoniensis TaxID=990121 RepID=A0A0V0YSE5_9BILA|nr:hypothetical protein T12_5526 [Trichinella patagoniensis]
MQPACGRFSKWNSFGHFNLMEVASNRQEMDIEHLIY